MNAALINLLIALLPLVIFFIAMKRRGTKITWDLAPFIIMIYLPFLQLMPEILGG